MSAASRDNGDLVSLAHPPGHVTGPVGGRATVGATAVEAMPSRSNAAILVLSVVDDPMAGIREVADVVGADPSLSCRILALANSSYYGLSRRVATLDLAVSVVGFNTVRALTLVLGTGLERQDAAPEGFWEAAALSAAAAGVLAPLFDAPTADSFCLGLLHTVGSALQHQASPVPGTCLPIGDAQQEHELLQAELEMYGVTHSEAAAVALGSWNFPPSMCEVIATHHDEILTDAPPLARVLHAARICTSLILTETSAASPEQTWELARISQGRINSHGLLGDLASLLDQVRAQATPLQTALATTSA